MVAYISLCFSTLLSVDFLNPLSPRDFNQTFDCGHIDFTLGLNDDLISYILSVLPAPSVRHPRDTHTHADTHTRTLLIALIKNYEIVPLG